MLHKAILGVFKASEFNIAFCKFRSVIYKLKYLSGKTSAKSNADSSEDFRKS